jgi:hypothetical protein
VAVTLWEHIDGALDGQLEALLIEWHSVEGIGTPTIAKRLNSMGFEVEQRTVWRWINQRKITKNN